jgi:signal peptidase I
MIPEAYITTIIGLLHEKGQKTVCTISGDSMAPLIKHGDTLEIEYGFRKIRRGDVLVFKNSGKVIAHRAVKIFKACGEEIILPKGDKFSHFDDPISRDDIIGKVTAVKGVNKSYSFHTIRWKLFNYYLAVLSYVSVKRKEEKSIFWTGINLLYALGMKLLPEKYSIKRFLLRRIIRIA